MLKTSISRISHCETPGCHLKTTRIRHQHAPYATPVATQAVLRCGHVYQPHLHAYGNRPDNADDDSDAESGTDNEDADEGEGEGEGKEEQ